MEKSQKKVEELLASGTKENMTLALIIAEKEFPFLWASLLGYTGPKLNKNLMEKIAEMPTSITIGNSVRYRGMKDCPNLCVLDIIFNTSASAPYGKPSIVAGSYTTSVRCKYYNKSTQGFSETIDRIECFEKIKSETNES